ncbi:transposase [Enterococcus faecalis]|nr:transposase [Enterococcus faecalis]
MSFIILNGQTRKLFNIVDERQLPYLDCYFSRFPLSVWEKEQFIVIDVYAPYVSLVKKYFPNSLTASVSFLRNNQILPFSFVQRLFLNTVSSNI